jgi:hypothetical protein
VFRNNFIEVYRLVYDYNAFRYVPQFLIFFPILISLHKDSILNHHQQIFLQINKSINSLKKKTQTILRKNAEKSSGEERCFVRNVVANILLIVKLEV